MRPNSPRTTVCSGGIGGASSISTSPSIVAAGNSNLRPSSAGGSPTFSRGPGLSPTVSLDGLAAGAARGPPLSRGAGASRRSRWRCRRASSSAASFSMSALILLPVWLAQTYRNAIAPMNRAAPSAPTPTAGNTPGGAAGTGAAAGTVHPIGKRLSAVAPAQRANVATDVVATVVTTGAPIMNTSTVSETVAGSIPFVPPGSVSRIGLPRTNPYRLGPSTTPAGSGESQRPSEGEWYRAPW